LKSFTKTVTTDQLPPGGARILLSVWLESVYQRLTGILQTAQHDNDDQDHRFSAANFAKFRGAICEILRNSAAEPESPAEASTHESANAVITIEMTMTRLRYD